MEGPPAPDLPAANVAPLPKVDKPTSTVIARVDGKPIFQSEVEAGVAASLNGQKLEPTQLARVQAAVLQKIIERELIHEFLIARKSVATEAEIDAAVERLRKTVQQQNSNLEDLLARTHQTEAALRTNYGYELGWNKFVAHNTTDERMEELFKKFQEQFDGTERRVSHILLRPDGSTDEAKLKDLVEQAKKLRDQIESGDITFEDAAAKYSAGPSHSHGGDIGYIPLEGAMAPQFSQTAFTLKPGDISQPVSSPFGIHLLKVTDIKPGTKTWQDVREPLQKTLSNYLFSAVAKEQFDKATIDYSPGVPHFKKGTMELDTSTPGAS
jgi:peptidyl-prolyl cis-trans isomerase C